MSADYQQYPDVNIDKRVRFYDGQFLKDQDFIDEQKYHLDRQRRLARSLSVAGICDGLTVSVAADKTAITVQPGTAIDEQGRQIVLTTAQTVIPANEHKNKTVNIVITYHDEPSDDRGDDTKGSKGYRRFHEKPQVTLVIGDEAPALAIALTQLTIDSSGKVSSSAKADSIRQYSGLQLPTSDGEGIILRSLNGASDLTHLSSSLTIQGALTISDSLTSANGPTLSVESASDGNQYARLSSSLIVEGDLTPTNSLKFSEGSKLQLKSGTTNHAELSGSLAVANNLTIDGKVGIGTAPASEQLKVAGNTAITGTLSVTGTASSTIAGNVGIGFTNPGAKLAVDGGLHVGGTSNPGDNNLLVDGNLTVNNTVALKGSPTTTGLTVNPSGNVGIGTTNPSAKLEVSGALKATNATLTGFLTVNGTQRIHLGTNIQRYDYGNKYGVEKGSDIDISINAGAYMLCQAIFCKSDKRGKNIHGHSNSELDLQTLLEIQITDFSYKDVINKGKTQQKKVIGQQVEQVFPQSVSRHIDVVPDIYESASVQDGWVILATDLKPGERVKLIMKNGEEYTSEVLEVTEEKFRMALKLKRDNVFVFGREVNDFCVVDYDAISMLNVSATQELCKRFDFLKIEVDQLKTAFANLNINTSYLGK